MTPPTGQRLGTAPRDRLRIAIQKSGRLAEPARSLLAACGLSWRESRDKLFCYGETLPVDLLLVRDDDIPGLIADGVCDLGIVGRNELDEQAGARARNGLAPAYRALRGLGFGQCRLMLAVPEEWEWTGPSQLQGLRIATSYPAVLGNWLDAQGIDAQVVELSGSVEIAPRLGTADLVCDLVSSGATLAANHLRPVENLLDSEAVLAGPAGAFDDARAGLAQMLLRRVDGVLQLKDRKLLMFNAERDSLPALERLLQDAGPLVELPGSNGVLSLQAMCEGAVSWQQLEELERAGARGLMVLAVERSLA
ncbi:ATP phosphoribosyltransferase [Pseudoxanthomonas koreensis]|uniref:ATP phosphoribosyltransferase n=1 Tax=Pseudoxanthomonas koreensis TaxID=266061 RepID=UPI001391DE1D|nr:ATP phosphoribosyltransferase [Pseudoxanthomonas koreensis]KAF1691653.1 ATP phosphoribosyltransferase [Pseudoxanthomonas koreensis]